MPGGFSGAREHQLVTARGKGLYPLICYEAIFPSEINGASATAAALLNVTNDAWFGNTPGPYQHFNQARLRAVERGLPLIRAANNGISAVVDAKGRVVSGLAYDVPGFVDATLPGRFSPAERATRQNTAFLIVLGILLAITLLSRLGFRNRMN